MTGKAHKSALRGASIFAMAVACQAAPAAAKKLACPGKNGALCEITVATPGSSVISSGDTSIINNATGTVITQPSIAHLLITNAADASISQIVFATGFDSPLPTVDGTVDPIVNSIVVLNQGSIDSNLTFSDAGGIYIHDGGTLNGNLSGRNFSSETFINRSGGGTGITGALNVGNGVDGYIDSFSTSANYVVPALPSGFDVNGVEARGAGTIVTILPPAAGAPASGLHIYGNGSIINRSAVDPIAIPAAFPDIPPQFLANARIPTVFYTGNPELRSVVSYADLWSNPRQTIIFSFTIGSALESFANEGIINGDVALNAASFSNSGTINLGSSGAGSYVQAAADRDFSFTNSGTITMFDNGYRESSYFMQSALTLASALDGTERNNAVVTNEAAGIISGGLSMQGFVSNLTFSNHGLIEIGDNPNLIFRAVEIGDHDVVWLNAEDYYLTPMDNVTILNTGQILGGLSGFFEAVTGSFENSGTIVSHLSDPRVVAIDIEMDYYYGPNGSDSIDGDSFSFTNSGTITGATNLDLEVSAVTVTNSGSMTQGFVGGDTAGFPGFGFEARALQIGQETTLDAVLTFNNSGDISDADPAAPAVDIAVEAGDIGSGVAGAEAANADVTVINSGRIETSGGVYLTPSLFSRLPNDGFLVTLSAGLSVSADAEGTSDISIQNQAGGEIVDLGGPLYLGQLFALDFVDPGPIYGTALVAIADFVSITNDGLIQGGDGAILQPSANALRFGPFGDNIISYEQAEFTIGNAVDTLYSEDLLINNASGVIQGGIALRQGDDRLENYGSITGNVFMGTGNDLVINEGAFSGALYLGDGDDVLVLSLASAAAQFTATADGGNGTDVVVFSVNNGGNIQDAAQPGLANFETTVLQGTGTITSTDANAIGVVQLAESDITLAADNAFSVNFRADAPGAQTLNNLGGIFGSVDLGADDDTFKNYGTLTGSLNLGDGDDSFIQGINAGFTGTADGGAGTDSFLIDITGGGTIDEAIYTQLVNFETLELTGTGNIATSGDNPLPFGTVQLGDDSVLEISEGSNISTQGPVAITGSDTGDELTNSGTIGGGVALGDGDDLFTNSGMTTGDIDLGTGDDEFSNTGSAEGGVYGGEGDDAIGNTGEIAGDLGSGSGDDIVNNSGTVGGDVNLDGTFTPSPSDSPEAKTLPLIVQFAAAAAPLTEGNDNFSNSGTVTGNVNAGGGNDVVSNSGTIGGMVDLGDGDDELLLTGAWSIGMGATGGAGGDVLGITAGGTDTMPQALDLAAFTEFETLDMNGGIGALSGNLNFSTFNINAGRLIGLSGSSITGNVIVDSGATFGSAGTVTGNIIVNGTLSPGASPAVMNVTGNVTLAAGSNSLFEFTPTLSDQLNITGALTIQNGASLTMTGDRPLTPGAYNLITATGGITGTFGTNVTRDSTVLGVLSYTANAVQLLSTFQAAADAKVQSGLTTAYINDLLIGGAPPAGILAAFPVLLNADGFADSATMGALSPEPYASAVQIGMENGLAVSDALRNVGMAGPEDDAGILVFGQAYGRWRTFQYDDRGVSSADVDTTGFVGGIGYGSQKFGLSLFAGRSDSKQSIDGINARNDADGMFYGGKLHFASGGLEAGASVIFDRSSADTVRRPLASPARSHYRLRSTTIDGYVGYGLEIGNGWRFGPQFGVTHISVKRGNAVETGGGDFGLTVNGQTYDATFVSADLKLSLPSSTPIRPWLSAGVRHRADGDTIAATGNFSNVTDGYTVFGAGRDKTLAHAAAGVEFSLGKNVDFYLSGATEFGADNGAQQLDAGVRLKF